MPRDKSEGDLSTDQTASGVKGGVSLRQACVRNVGTCRCDDKGAAQTEAL